MDYLMDTNDGNSSGVGFYCYCNGCQGCDGCRGRCDGCEGGCKGCKGSIFIS